MKNHRVLVIAAHPDDEILGVGGTVRRLVSEGSTANCMILGEGLTSRKNFRSETAPNTLDELQKSALDAASIIGYCHVDFCSLPDNRFDTVPLLDIIKMVDMAIEKFTPDIIFTHHHGDLNIDHQKTFEAVLTACRPIIGHSVKELYSFYIPSSTEWNFSYGHTSFSPNYFVDISQTLNAKLDAMRCYTTEIRDFPHPRSLVALSAIAKTWGSVAGMLAAEAFHLVLKTYGLPNI